MSRFQSCVARVLTCSHAPEEPNLTWSLPFLLGGQAGSGVLGVPECLAAAGTHLVGADPGEPAHEH